MNTVCCKLIPSVFTVTRRTHILGVMLAVGVFASRNQHDFLSALLFLLLWC